jgi:hypothetical protein
LEARFSRRTSMVPSLALSRLRRPW